MSIDFSQYQTWPVVRTPGGGTYYQVPGTSYVYDPFLSQAKGKPVVFNNPQPKLDDINRQRGREDKVFAMQENAASPMGQLLPIAGTVAGTVGAAYLADQFKTPSLIEQAIANNISNGGVAANGATAAGGTAVGGGGAAASEGAEAAFQAGAQGGTEGSTGFLAPGSTASNILGGAGVALGSYGVYQGIKDKNPVMAGMGGLGVAAGLSQLGWAVPGIGWAVAVAAPVVGALINKMGDKDVWDNERKDLMKLRDKGTFIPDELINQMPQRGRSREELVRIAEETGGNVQFAKSRDEKDLRGADIVGFSTFAKQDPEWFNRPLEQRINYAQQLLDAGLVREHHATIDVKWDKAPVPPWNNAPSEQPAAQSQKSTRSNTLSPGIGLDGKRLGQALAERSNKKSKK